MSNKEFASGIYFDRNEKAPDFVAGRISINVDKFVDWLSTQPRSEKGYVNMNVLRKRANDGYYIELDTWQPAQNGSATSSRTSSTYAGGRQISQQAALEDDLSDVPF